MLAYRVQGTLAPSHDLLLGLPTSLVTFMLHTVPQGMLAVVVYLIHRSHSYAQCSNVRVCFLVLFFFCDFFFFHADALAPAPQTGHCTGGG